MSDTENTQQSLLYFGWKNLTTKKPLDVYDTNIGHHVCDSYGERYKVTGINYSYGSLELDDSVF